MTDMLYPNGEHKTSRQFFLFTCLGLMTLCFLGSTTVYAQDADGDNILDDVDNCPGDPNPLQEDTDVDEVGDACDVCPGSDDTVNADGDGSPDGCDLCPGFDDRIDTDNDGLADGCDHLRE